MFDSLKAMIKDRLVNRLGRCGMVALLMFGGILGCQSADQPVEVASSQQYERGPHGGRILRDGDIAVEIKIYEAGTPPRFRVYGFRSGRPINPNELSGKILLKRLGGELEDFILEPIQRPAESDVGDLFLGNSKDVKEPHSFDLNISLNYQGKKYSWSYPSYEYRTVIPADVASDAGLKFEKATSREISSTRRLRGKVTPSEHRVAHVIPRFAGVVREGRKHIGDSVEKGEVMAIIESNQSLQPFEVRSQIAGTVVNGHLIVGEFVPENQWVFVVADLSEVWVDFAVSVRDRSEIDVGDKVRVSSPSEDYTTEATISYISPFVDERTQSQLFRGVIANREKRFFPGTYIAGDVTTDAVVVPIAVKREAVQRLGNWDVVFIKIGDTYEARPVVLGRRDSSYVEIVDGINSGDEFVAGNSFIVKADILKAGASHDH